MYTYTAGKVRIPQTECFLEENYFCICFFLDRIMGLMMRGVVFQLSPGRAHPAVRGADDRQDLGADEAP